MQFAFPCEIHKRQTQPLILRVSVPHLTWLCEFHQSLGSGKTMDICELASHLVYQQEKQIAKIFKLMWATDADTSGVNARSTRCNQSVKTIDKLKPGSLSHAFGAQPCVINPCVVCSVALWGACSPKDVYTNGPEFVAPQYIQQDSLTQDVFNFNALCKYFWSPFKPNRTPLNGPQIGPDTFRSHGLPYKSTFINRPSWSSVKPYTSHESSVSYVSVIARLTSITYNKKRRSQELLPPVKGLAIVTTVKLLLRCDSASSPWQRIGKILLRSSSLYPLAPDHN